jgi:predicted ferric reductase
MSDPKAERLAAVRAANARRRQEAAPAPGAAEPDSAAPPVAPPTPPATADTVRLAPARAGAEADYDSSLSFASVGLIVLAAVGGALLGIVLPSLLPGVRESLLGPEPKAYWYLARSSAFVAYALLWLSMALGLMMTNKLARLWPGGPLAFELHEHASILGLAFGLFHALILLGDRYANYSLAQILVPFASGGSLAGWVGLGQVGLYLMGVVGLSFYVRPLIGRAAWRLVHFLSFVIFGLALLHGVFSGSDTGAAWAQLLYWLSGGSLLFLTIYRVLVGLARPARPAPRAERAAGG